MGSKTTAALVQIGVYLALTTVGLGGYMLWEHKVKKGAKKDITIEQQDDVIKNQNTYDKNKSEDRVKIEDEARNSNTRESTAAQDLINSQARALRDLEKRNAELEKYVANNAECLRNDWPEQLRVVGGDPIRGTGKNRSTDSE